MEEILFPDFLDSRGRYRAAEAFWESMWAEIVRPYPQHRWAHPWVGTGGPDILDGNPIFSAISPPLRRGVRVIQSGPGGPDAAYAEWHDRTEPGDDGPDAIEELVIACELSRRTADRARASLTAWAAGSPWIGSGRAGRSR
jgi:hypothetical protein